MTFLNPSRSIEFSTQAQEASSNSVLGLNEGPQEQFSPPRVLDRPTTEEIENNGVYEVVDETGQTLNTYTHISSPSNHQQTIYSDNDVGLSFDPEEEEARLSINRIGDGEIYNFRPGWNLVNFSLLSASGENMKASDVMQEWNIEESPIIHIASFSDGKFSTYSQRTGDRFYGDDFEIEPGSGIFVFATNATAKRLVGKFPGDDQKISLNAGWNLISLRPSPNTKATDLVNLFEMNGASGVVISQFDGSYQSGISEDGTFYGTDFNIANNRGYFVRLTLNSNTDQIEIRHKGRV